jgi:hypothetical protein
MELYLTGLADLSDAQVETAIAQAVMELRFFPKVAELRDLAGASQQGKQDAEARMAWDVLASFVKKFVSNDVHGNYGPEFGWYSTDYPKLSDRIIDTVRRTGGWKIYKCMSTGDFPFVQKRFFEEYAAWAAVEKIAVQQWRIEAPKPSLLSKPTAVPEGGIQPRPAGQQVAPKTMPPPLTDAQIRDRREMLRQQVESWTQRSR